MMERLWSVAPHTLGVLRPAWRATSTNRTGDAGEEVETADTGAAVFFHRQSGVVSASSKLLPSTTSEEPRKRRRGKLISYRPGTLGKGWGTSPAPSFTAIIWSTGKFVKRSTWPLDFERFDFGALAQAKENSGIAG